MAIGARAHDLPFRALGLLFPTHPCPFFLAEYVDATTVVAKSRGGSGGATLRSHRHGGGAATGEGASRCEKPRCRPSLLPPRARDSLVLVALVVVVTLSLSLSLCSESFDCFLSDSRLGVD